MTNENNPEDVLSALRSLVRSRKVTVGVGLKHAFKTWVGASVMGKIALWSVYLWLVIGIVSLFFNIWLGVVLIVLISPYYLLITHIGSWVIRGKALGKAQYLFAFYIAGLIAVQDNTTGRVFHSNTDDMDTLTDFIINQVQTR